MPQYRALRERYGLLDICRSPELAVEVTLQPVDEIDVDAAIIFSDLLLPLEPMGLPFSFVKGEGPSFDNPLRVGSGHRSTARNRPTRGTASRARCDRPRARSARRTRAADRLRGRAVHAGVICDRRRTIARFREDEVADVRPSRSVASSLRTARGRGQRIPSRASERGRAGDSGVRLVGRLAERRRLSRVRAAAFETHSRCGESDRRSDHSFRNGHVEHSCPTWRRRAATWLAPTGASRWTMRGS